MMCIFILLTKCNCSKTLQQCLERRRRNGCLQQVYNSRKTVRMGVSAHVTIPTLQKGCKKPCKNNGLQGAFCSL